MKTIIRLLPVIALGASIALWSPTTQAAQSDITLKVACYGGAFTASQKKYVGDIFTQRTGIKIQYIDANPQDHLAKLIASRGREAPYDVVYFDDISQPAAITAGVIDKIDPALVTNMKFIYDEAKNAQGYAPAFLFYSVGIAYNYEKFKAAGIPDISSWEDLWNPKLAGRVLISDLGTTSGRDALVAAARLNGGDERSLNKGIEKLATLKAHSYPVSSSMIESLMQAGDAWVVPWVNGRAWGMIDKGAPLRFVMPKEGGFGHFATTDLVKGTKYPKEAQAYINQALDPLGQLGQANEAPYGPVNKLLAGVMEAYPELSQKFPKSPAELNALYRVDWNAFNANYRQAMDMWNRKVLQK